MGIVAIRSNGRPNKGLLRDEIHFIFNTSHLPANLRSTTPLVTVIRNKCDEVVQTMPTECHNSPHASLDR